MKNKGRDEQDKISKAIVSGLVGEVLSHKIILCELREGRQAAAIEALESAIDGVVCMIWRKTINTDEVLREMATNALRVIQEYRKKYPRAHTANDSPSDLAESAESMRKEAAEILSRISASNN
jgi:hypothetical protein